MPRLATDAVLRGKPSSETLKPRPRRQVPSSGRPVLLHLPPTTGYGELFAASTSAPPYGARDSEVRGSKKNNRWIDRQEQDMKADLLQLILEKHAALAAKAEHETAAKVDGSTNMLLLLVA
jgi:hypothetical protein